jgi:KaiC/GvpD/RAD55 family RecA-like ATPase
MYREIWRCFGSGATLVEGEQVVSIRGLRNRYGKYSYGRPGVFSTLAKTLGDAIPATLLSDWYRANLCARFDIIDSPDFIIFSQEWLSRFNQINLATYSRNALLDLVNMSEVYHLKKWVEGLIETLDYLALIQYTDKNRLGYKLRFKANPAFVLASLFGRSTGIQGLDYLLFGGLWVPGRSGSAITAENLTAVVSGPPGMGKSTLALSMGVQVAARGGFCLYFRFEPDEVAVLRQIVQFYRSLLPHFHVVSHSGELLHPRRVSVLEQTRPSSHGLMLISDIATAPIEEITKTTIALANDPQAENFAERIVIFDSISAAQDYERDVTVWRKFLFEISSILRALGYVVVFVVEREKGTTVNFEDYIADLDIRLAHRETHYSFRTLEIAKSRWQASHRGSHVYSIEADQGIRVAPSSNAVLSARRLREARIRYEENRFVSPGIINFALYLGGTEAKTGQDDQVRVQGEKHRAHQSSNRSGPKGTVPWWKQGSVTALIGPRGTYKKAFARSFSKTLEEDIVATPCALSLHFADEFQSIRQQFRREKQQPNPFGVRYDMPLQPEVHDKLSPTLSYILFRSGFLAPGFVLQTVRDIIREKRKSQTPIRRAVISDAGNIAPNFPALKDDPVFIPALCDLLTTEGITTIIVYSPPEQGTYDPALDQIRSVAENLVKFDHISYAGREYTSIKVQRSADNTHDRGLYEIRQREQNRSKEDLEIVPAFDLVLDIHTGTPKVAKVKITLDSGTELQHQWNYSVKSLYQGLGAYDIQIIDHNLAFARQGVPPHVMGTEGALWIAQVDAYELPANPRSTDQRRSGFCSLSMLSPRFNQGLKDLSHAAIILRERQFPNDKVRQPALSVPFYLNPSFLVVRNEFRDFVLGQDKWQNISEGLGQYSWDDLISAVNEFRATDSVWADYASFYCNAGSSEVLNCVFLEILASFSNGDLRDKDFIRNFGSDSPFSSGGENLFVKAVLTLRHLIKDTYQGYHPAIPHQITRRPAGSGSPDSVGTQPSRPNINQKAIIWRHWYSTFRQMAADMAGGDCSTNQELSLLRLPGGVWTNGDWHLAILEGSIGTRLGVDIIFDRFVNRPTAMAMMAQGVGLPPFADFYTNKGELPVAGVAPNWFAPYVSGEGVIYRSSLKGYKRIASILSSYLGSMISLDVENESELVEQIKVRFASMNEIIKEWG